MVEPSLPISLLFSPTSRGRPSVAPMRNWEITNAQQAVNIVAAVMAGQPRNAVALELHSWLERRGAVLPEPLFAEVVDAVTEGNSIVTLRAVHRPAPAVGTTLGAAAVRSTAATPVLDLVADLTVEVVRERWDAFALPPRRVG